MHGSLQVDNAVAIDHPGRTFLALAVFFRHVGLVDDELSPRLRELASTRMLDRARVLGLPKKKLPIIKKAIRIYNSTPQTDQAETDRKSVV